MKGCLRSLLIFVLIVTVLHVILNLLDGSPLSVDFTDDNRDCEEYMREEPSSMDREHQRYWGFRESNSGYCLNYETLEGTSNSAKTSRAEMRVSYQSENFWGDIYASLVDQAGSSLDYLADSLMRVGSDKGLSRLDLARLTVSFVQDIPYSYVVPSGCEDYLDSGKPCLGNVPYGIIGPYEFVHTLYGDCDTRSVLLYMLLEEMRFEPMIVVSQEYAHAMLALSIPAHGDFISHKGRKYYFWETTAKGWGIGMLPPDSNNVDYWEIALVNES